MKNTALAIGFGLLLMLAAACGSDHGDAPQTDGDGVDRVEDGEHEESTIEQDAETAEQDAEPLELDSDCPQDPWCKTLGYFCDGGQYAGSCVLDEQGCLVSRVNEICDGAAVCSGGKCVCSSIYNDCEYEQDGMTKCEGSVVVTCTYYGGTCGQWEKGTDCALQNKSCENGSCVAPRRAE